MNTLTPMSTHPARYPPSTQTNSQATSTLLPLGDDWFVLYNPRVPRSLDISLIYDFSHDSVVCCARFSKDGNFLATGCSRATQIFDIRTGLLVSILEDEGVSQDEDLYIRAVCFSPDGKYVATAAEDGLVRVRLFFLYSTPFSRPSNPQRIHIDMGYQPTKYLPHFRRA
jgi:WD40 repeat protein